jgi:6-pyruvoyltetrahydropterin/6-carboxytetrahydropterin synthase
MISITRRLEFDAGHRVMNHESKCGTLHGHRYVVELTAVAEQLDAIGRIIDFSILKQKIGEWIDDKWDHTMILYRADAETVSLVSRCPSYKPPYLCDFNPTAENMAHYLLWEICPILLKDTAVRVTKVKIWETPNCSAEASI